LIETFPQLEQVYGVTIKAPKINLTIQSFKNLSEIGNLYKNQLPLSRKIYKFLIVKEKFAYTFTDSIKTIRLDK